jgi:hypothetical protein
MREPVKVWLTVCDAPGCKLKLETFIGPDVFPIKLMSAAPQFIHDGSLSVAQFIHDVVPETFTPPEVILTLPDDIVELKV